MVNKIIKVLSIIIVALLVVFVQKFPTIYAAWHVPDGYKYTYQASWFDPWDINVYVTAVRHGHEEGILLKNHYNSIPQQRPSLIYPIYTISGKVSSANPFIIFHVLAGIVGFFLTIVIFFNYKRIFNSHKFALLATLVCVLGGGIGAILGKTDISAASQITSFSFQSAVQRAHEGMGIALYVSALMTTFYYYETKKTKKTAALIICLLLLNVLFYPYNILSYLVIAFSYVYSQVRTFRISPYLLLMFVAIVVGAATLAYYFHLQNSTFSAAASENLPNVSIPAVLIGYGGFIFFFALNGFMEKTPLSSQHKKIRLFFILWIVISVILSYLPGVGFSRFFLRGLFFPFTGLMFVQLFYTKNHVAQYFMAIFFVALLLFSRFNIFMLRIEEVQEKNPWIYTEATIIEALEFLKERPDDGVMSLNFAVANFIPAYTGKRVYLGHMLQTPDTQTRIRLIERFYSGEFTEQEARDFLQENKIRYVIYYKDHPRMPVPSYGFMKNVFKNENVKIFSPV